MVFARSNSSCHEYDGLPLTHASIQAVSGCRALELFSELRWQATQCQRAAFLVELDLVAQQVRFEADRHSLGPAGEAPEQEHHPGEDEEDDDEDDGEL